MWWVRGVGFVVVGGEGGLWSVGFSWLCVVCGGCRCGWGWGVVWGGWAGGGGLGGWCGDFSGRRCGGVSGGVRFGVVFGEVSFGRPSSVVGFWRSVGGVGGGIGGLGVCVRLGTLRGSLWVRYFNCIIIYTSIVYSVMVRTLLITFIVHIYHTYSLVVGGSLIMVLVVVARVKRAMVFRGFLDPHLAWISRE